MFEKFFTSKALLLRLIAFWERVSQKNIKYTYFQNNFFYLSFRCKRNYPVAELKICKHKFTHTYTHTHNEHKSFFSRYMLFG